MNEEIMYSIAEASERLKVSNRTLRHYEEKFEYEVSRDTSGNRQYTEADLEIFEQIISLKSKGLTLNAIKKIFQDEGLIGVKNKIIIPEEQNEVFSFFVNEIKKEVALTMELSLKETNEKLSEALAIIEENKKATELILKENRDLKDELKKYNNNTEDHYKMIDDKLIAWRNSSKRPWYEKIFSKEK